VQAWQVSEWCDAAAMPLVEAPIPEPGPAQALVQVHTAALNFFDNLMIGGRYQVKPPFPFTPGCEVAGEVVAAGPASDFRPGDRVASQLDWGGFAEYCLVENVPTNRVPDSLPLDIAATIPVVYPTAHIALQRRGRLQPGEFVLVAAGAGGVGLAAIQLARAWGGRPIALAGSAEKRRICLENGAELALDYADDAWVEAVRAHTGGRGFDLLFDPVGGQTFDRALKVIAWEGRAVIIGFAGGEIQRIAANRLLLKNASAVGAIWGRYLTEEPVFAHRVVQECFDMAVSGAIAPVVWRTYPFAELPAALAALDGRQTYGKAMLRVGG
jgi:NADPH2:quinone reductase